MNGQGQRENLGQNTPQTCWNLESYSEKYFKGLEFWDPFGKTCVSVLGARLEGKVSSGPVCRPQCWSAQ